MKPKNDSMTDEIGTKTTVILSQNKNIENKIWSLSAIFKKKDQNIGLASYTKMLKLFGNLPCRGLLERMKSYGSCPKDKKTRCHWIGYPL